MVTHALAYGQARRTANQTCRSTRGLASDGDLAEPYTRMILAAIPALRPRPITWLAIRAPRQRTTTEPRDNEWRVVLELIIQSSCMGRNLFL